MATYLLGSYFSSSQKKSLKFLKFYKDLEILYVAYFQTRSYANSKRQKVNYKIY